MDEDEAYRASSQYRLWSFTADQLLERRTETNQFAAEKVRAAFARASTAQHDRESSPEANAATSKSRDPLTVEEEQVIVQWGCSKIIEIKEVLDPKPSSVVIATAIQYLRRFYLANSPMTYHPTQIMLCALFLAMKAEHMYFSLSRFTRQLSIKTEDEVRAPEFLLMQALRFTLDVRHPMKGLEGCRAEIERRSQLGSISILKSMSKYDIDKRLKNTHDHAYFLLTKDTQMTDAYFLYTPPQICLAAMYIADKDLTLSYLDDLLQNPKLTFMKQKLIETTKSCASLIQSQKAEETKFNAEMKRVSKKLRRCQDPEKTDIVAVSQDKRSSKADGSESDDLVAEKKAKKRKLEAMKTAERDGDVFGGDLKK